MNTIEERHLEAGIATVLRLCPEDDRKAVRAFLTRAIYGQSWSWVAARVGCSERSVLTLAQRGREALHGAIRHQRLSREALAQTLEDASSMRRIG